MPAAMLHSPRGRRGISLLEVLISIGIISIGLLATFSLIPAGRSYMQKAAVDDRAAALVPAAFETIASRGLLKTTSLSWEDVPDNPAFTDPEISGGAVIREQSRKDVTDPALYPGNTGLTRDDLWTLETTDTETITTPLYDRPVPFTTLTGTVNPGSPPAVRTVTIASSPVSGPNGTATSDLTTGRWTLDISGLVPLQAPDMQITTSGPGVGNVSNTPYTDYTFTATYTDDMGTPRTSAITPASPYRQYGRRRKLDNRTGRALLEYTRPANATESNQDPASASTITIKTLDNASGTKRNSVAKSVTKQVNGTLWRMTLGTVRNTYTQDVDFADANNAPPQPRTPVCQNTDITVNAGTFVSGSADVDDEVDWYQFPVRAAEIIKIQNVGSDDGLLAKDPETNTRYFPAYLNSLSGTMSPLPGFTDADYYFIPQDGTLLVRAALSPTVANTFGPTGQPRYDATGAKRANPAYKINISRLPSERAVVVDPLAATRLDRALINSATAENLLRRQRFADYTQVYAGLNRPQQRIIPRLNWAQLANTPTPTDVDAAIAAAELLFRDSDSLLIDTSGTFATADGAPGPLFDLDGSNNPVRRQSAGKMSWLMMLQPEDAGPVSVNWTSGKWFDVSVVIFEDRALPALTGSPYTGEYAQANVAGQSPLRGVWSDLDGSLTVEIPSNATATDLAEDDDIRRLFRTGAWILLAPKVIDPDESPLDSTTRLDWVRVQSARLGSISGTRTVSLLLESEPGDKTLNRSLQTTAPNYEVVVLAYSGVVAVVNRSVQLE